MLRRARCESVGYENAIKISYIFILISARGPSSQVEVSTRRIRTGGEGWIPVLLPPPASFSSENSHLRLSKDCLQRFDITAYFAAKAFFDLSLYVSLCAAQGRSETDAVAMDRLEQYG
jgi:hypothetical protein